MEEEGDVCPGREVMGIQNKAEERLGGVTKRCTHRLL